MGLSALSNVKIAVRHFLVVLPALPEVFPERWSEIPEFFCSDL
jgi:hypothetical protein